GSSSAAPPLTQTPPPAVSATISSSSQSVNSGSSITLSWSSTNASACSATGAWSGSLTTSGTKTVGPLTQPSTFGIPCTAADGAQAASATPAVSVVTPPTISFAAGSSSVAYGDGTVLTWSATGATTCTQSNGWSGSVDPAGSVSSGPLTQNTTFTLTCKTDAG